MSLFSQAGNYVKIRTTPLPETSNEEDFERIHISEFGVISIGSKTISFQDGDRTVLAINGDAEANDFYGTSMATLIDDVDDFMLTLEEAGAGSGGPGGGGDIKSDGSVNFTGGETWDDGSGDTTYIDVGGVHVGAGGIDLYVGQAKNGFETTNGAGTSGIYADGTAAFENADGAQMMVGQSGTIIDLQDGNTRLKFSTSDGAFMLYGTNGDDEIYFDFNSHIYYLIVGDNSTYEQWNDRFLFNNGNVGIHCSSPFASLQLGDNSGNRATYYQSIGSDGGDFVINSYNYEANIFRIDGDDSRILLNESNTDWRTIIGGTNGDYPVTIRQSGTNSGYGVIQFGIQGSDSEIGIQLDNIGSGGSSRSIFVTNDGSGIGGSLLAFNNIGSERTDMVIDENGWMGIATIAPEVPLHVNGAFFVGTTNPYGVLKSDPGDFTWFIGDFNDAADGCAIGTIDGADIQYMTDAAHIFRGINFGPIYLSVDENSLAIRSTNISMPTLQKFASNALAIGGGLETGNLYYSDVAGDGVLKIVL